jgi:transposase
MRELKALEIAARSRIAVVDGVWSVPSQASATKTYRVTLGESPSCQCEDWSLRQQGQHFDPKAAPCKHILAARLTCERDHGGNPPPIVTDAVPKRPTYTQNWTSYNQAQSQEKDRLQVLLADLCSGITEPPQTTGRKRVPLADRIFAVCFKVWSTLSSRRFNCDMERAHELGYLSRPVHYNKVSCFMEDEELTPYLRAMLVRSALPLRTVETAFAVDSSGFSTSRFIRWFDHKYGVERREHDWVKVHLVCGVNTHVVTAAVIYNRDAADSPLLPELLKTTAENFTVKEMTADKGYLSVENVEAIFEAGGIPFIAPKSNTTGAAGGLFEKMYRYYQYRREDFLRHYHQRSNVESVFSAVKRKFGDSVRSKTPKAMANEVLAKLICNNLCCVILSQIELGIEAEFWQNDGMGDGERPSILPLTRNDRA